MPTNLERLYQAIQQDNVAEVEALVRQGLDLNAIPSDRYDPPLITAISFNHTAVFIKLCELGAEWKKQNRYGINAFHQAALTSSNRVFVQTLTNRGAQFDEPAFAAAYHGDLEFFKIGPFTELITLKDNIGCYVTHYAAAQGHIHLLQYFLEQGTHGQPFTKNNHLSATPLHLAVVADQTIDTINCLLHHRASNSKNAKNRFGQTVLMLAVEKGHTSMVECLTKAGADKEEKDSRGRTALLLAVEKGHTSMVECLIKAGADKEAKDSRNCTALLLAVEKGHTSTVECLIKAGADKEAKDSRNCTALLLAAEKGHTSTVECLIKAGADKEAKHLGRTALLLATEKGHTSTVECLIKAGVDKESKDRDGKTALTYAVENNHTEIVDYLIRSGVKINYDYADKIRTPLHQAIDAGHVSVVHAFLKYRAIGAELTCPSLRGIDVSGCVLIGSHVLHQAWGLGRFRRAESAGQQGTLQAWQYKLVTQNMLQEMGAVNYGRAITDYAKWLEAIEEGYAQGDVKQQLQQLANLETEIKGKSSEGKNSLVYRHFHNLYDGPRTPLLKELSLIRTRYTEKLLRAFRQPVPTPRTRRATLRSRPVRPVPLTPSEQQLYQQKLSDFICNDDHIGLQQLIETVPDLNVGQNPQSIITALNRPHCLRYLRDQGIGRHWRDSANNTLLHTAAVQAATTDAVIDLLSVPATAALDYRHLVNVQNKRGETCLHLLAKRGFTGPLVNLKQNGAIIDYQTSLGAETALHVAVRCKRAEFVEKFINVFREELKDPDYRFSNVGSERLVLAPIFRNNLVSTAVRYYDAKTFDTLEKLLPLALWVDEIPPRVPGLELDDSILDQINSTGRKPIHWAAQSSQAEEILPRLLRLGAMADAQDSSGRTPLHYLISAGNEAAIRIILPYLDADALNCADTQGITPLRLAKGRPHSAAIISLLQERRGLIPPLNTLPTYSDYLRLASHRHIRHLVFEGGGPKGIAYVGALTELVRAGIELKRVVNVGGTSAGAITALLLAVGYTYNEMQTMLVDLPIATFLDHEQRRNGLFRIMGQPTTREPQANYMNVLTMFDTLLSLPVVPAVPGANILKEIIRGIKILQRAQQIGRDLMTLYASLQQLQADYGLFPGDAIREWLAERVADKLSIYYDSGNRERAKLATFADLNIFQQRGHPVRNLAVIGTDISTRSPSSQIFSVEMTPDAIIVDAVRISLSIPVIYAPHYCYKRVRGQRVVDPSGHLYVDGGLSANYPIHYLFDKVKYLRPDHPHRHGNPEQRIANDEVLGFRLIEDKGLYEAYETGAPLPEQITSYATPSWSAFWQTLVKPVAKAMLHQQEAQHIISGDQFRTVYIHSLDVSFLDFNLTAKDQAALMQQGRESVERFLRRPPEATEQGLLFTTPALISLLKAQLQTIVQATGERIQSDTRHVHSGTEELRIKANLSAILDPAVILQLLANADEQEIKHLFYLGLQLNARDAQGRTPLHLAVAASNIKQVQAILKVDGENLKHNAQDKQNHTALDLAYSLSHTTLQEKQVRYQIIFALLKHSIYEGQPTIIRNLIADLTARVESPMANRSEINRWIGVLRQQLPVPTRRGRLNSL